MANNCAGGFAGAAKVTAETARRLSERDEHIADAVATETAPKKQVEKVHEIAAGKLLSKPKRR